MVEMERHGRRGREIVRRAPIRKETPVEEEKGLRQFLSSPLPMRVNFAADQFDSLPVAATQKKALMTYYLWATDNAHFELVRKYLGIQKPSQINDLLDEVMNSDDLVKSYEETVSVITTSISIFSSSHGGKTREALDKIALELSTKKDEELTAKSIAKEAHIVNPPKEGSTRTERTQIYMERLKAKLEEHMKEFGDKPINLKALSEDSDFPSYHTLALHYHKLAETMPVPPLSRGLKNR